MVSKLTEELGLTETGIMVSEDIDLDEQWRATTGQENMRMLAYYDKILKEKRLSCHTSVLDFFKLSPGTRASPLVGLLVDNGDDDPVQEEKHPL